MKQAVFFFFFFLSYSCDIFPGTSWIICFVGVDNPGVEWLGHPVVVDNVGRVVGISIDKGKQVVVLDMKIK